MLSCLEAGLHEISFDNVLAVLEEINNESVRTRALPPGRLETTTFTSSSVNGMSRPERSELGIPIDDQSKAQEAGLCEPKAFSK